MTRRSHKATPQSINLLRRQEPAALDKLMRWVLSTGRFIVILTEVIALSAFLYRFSLDRQLIDTRDKIKQKQNIVRLLEKNEERYRNLQNRLAIIASLKDQAGTTAALLGNIASIAPQEIYFQNFAVSDKNISIEATTQAANSLKTFIRDLQNFPRVQTISIDRIENKISTAMIVVAIKATLR